ncbi:hypothetical protein R3P38DRAFT_3596089 [Favolaschia claudopus]|uniref:F-box domain-containing protein n=1 Tax=Favolaschia claudopus TaxID=2862362 RepID=A0AAW0DN16_9AGAR
MASSPPLPLDLLRPIVSHIIDLSTLVQLCQVSKTFLQETRPRLFSDVSLRSTDVSLFCRTIFASCGLGAAVLRLSIQLGNDFDELEALAITLRALSNLRELEITEPQPRAWANVFVRTRQSILTSWKHSGSAWTLRGCTFRLRVFRTAFRVGVPDMLAFLQSQDSIEELALFATEGESVMLSAKTLPRLTKLKSAATHLQFEVEDTTTRRIFHEERMDVQVLMGTTFL